LDSKCDFISSQGLKFFRFYNYQQSDKRIEGKMLLNIDETLFGGYLAQGKFNIADNILELN
jgi:hypothetical protein